MMTRLKWRTVLRCLPAILLAGFAGAANAHTLPISYLRVVPDADYLHLELVFNPFELSFMSEVDTNKDAELSPPELEARGEMVAQRVTGAFTITVGGTVLKPETTGMDPDLSGHHVRLRAHYKVDARRVPLTVDSDLISLTSGSHLTQVTYVSEGANQMAQLDSQSRRVTFEPPVQTKESENRAPPSREKSVFSLFLLFFAIFALLAVGAGVLLYVRRQILS